MADKRLFLSFVLQIPYLDFVVFAARRQMLTIRVENYFPHGSVVLEVRAF
jgi:hypothetical protein